MITPWPRGPDEEVLAARRVVDLLTLRARREPQRALYTFLSEEGRETLTAAALLDDARRVAGLLQTQTRPGDRVLLLFGSGLDFVRAFLGCQAAGVVPVPAMPPRDGSPAELGRVLGILQDAGARVVLTLPALAAMGRAMAPNLCWMDPEALAEAPLAEVLPAGRAPDLALLQYTSGSTASPKGVMVGQDNLLHNLGDIYWAERNAPDTISVSWLPMTHDMGLIEGVLQPLYAGHPVYLMPPQAFLRRPLAWLDLVSEVGATVSGGPDFAYALVLRRLGQGPLPPWDLSRWRFAYDASEPVRAATVEAFCARMAPAGFRREALHALYGLAEATLGVTEGRGGRGPRALTRGEGPARRVLVSCGHVAPDMALAIVDPRTRERLAPGEEGEIWLSGPCVTRGYWGRAEATAETFGAALAGEGGRWLRTGDLGFTDGGELFVSGRLKEMFVVAGRNVFPDEVERSAEEAHPALRPGGSAAFAAPGEEGERVVLVAELAAEVEDPGAVARAVARALARRHGLALSELILAPRGTVPRTTSGKRQRLRLARARARGELPPPVAHTGPDEADLIGIITSVSALLGVSGGDLDLTRTLPDLGLDSVQVLELHLDHGGGLPLTDWLSRPLAELARGAADAVPAAPRVRLPEGFVVRAAPRAGPPRRVLVTGATGFVGGAVTLELLARPGVEVVALVRGDRGRLLDALRQRAGWDEAMAARLHALPGDLGAPGWAEALPEGVDGVVHGAAMVNWVYPYEALADTNVGGTRAVLELAASRGLPVVHLSTLACCWSAGAAGEVDEDTDPMGLIEGIHMGYVRSKAVAESLARQAAARGLPLTVLRPGLIFSDARSGEHLPGDFLSTLLRGCVELGAAPDLDWALETCTVDAVARAAVRGLAQPGQAWHVLARERRPWRALVLWLRLRGHDVALLPYREWCARLEAEGCGPGGALRALSPFFLRPVPGQGGLTLPQLYEAPRRNRISSARSLAALGPSPPLDAALLERTLTRLHGRGHFPPPPRALPEATGFDAALLEAALGRRVRSVARLDDGEPGRHSVVGELAAWRTGGRAGVRRLALTLEDGALLRVAAKSQTPGALAFEIAGAVAALCGEGLGAAWAASRPHAEVTRGAQREAALYALGDPAFARWTPRRLGQAPGLLLLEDLGGLPTLDRVDEPSAWGAAARARAVEGLVGLHAFGLGRTFDAPWMPPARDAAALEAQAPLWEALGEHALRGPFGRWLGPAGRARQRALRGAVGGWARVADGLPRGLIHNDLNPRNAALREDGRLVVFDWELATLGLPQRDLAELLCFTLDAEADAAEVHALIEAHRAGLEAATGRALDPLRWREGFAVALADLMVTRLPLYAMIDAFKPQAFLERVVGAWRALDALGGGHARR